MVVFEVINDSYSGNFSTGGSMSHTPGAQSYTTLNATSGLFRLRERPGAQGADLPCLVEGRQLHGRAADPRLHRAAPLTGGAVNSIFPRGAGVWDERTASLPTLPRSTGSATAHAKDHDESAEDWSSLRSAHLTWFAIPCAIPFCDIFLQNFL